MSLIHDALREIDKGASPAPGASDFRALAPAGPAPSRWLPFAGGMVAVLAVAAAGGWVWKNTQPPAPLAVQAAVPAVAAPVPSVAPAASAPVAVADAAPLPVSVSAPAPRVEKDVVGDSSTTPAPVARSAGASRAAGQGDRPRAARAAKPAVVPASVADVAPLVPVEKRYALFLASMKAGDLVGAREQLTALQSQIPPGTMSRLRAEAWFALQSGNEVDARRGYQDILERVPGDEEASINLASIEARAGHRESARQVLTDALANNPGSEALLATLARFKAPARN